MGRFFTKSAETARAGCSAGRAGRIHPHGESVKKACHCEETQRADVVIRSYCGCCADGGPLRTAAPTDEIRHIP